jgi:lysine 2,3-aminomutase
VGGLALAVAKCDCGPFVNFAIRCPLPTTNCAVIGTLETEYKTAIPPYYFSLINPEDPADPIRLQSVPSPLEQDNPSGYELEDPLEEDKDMPVPGLTHRYPDRCLLVTTHVCTMYCRFCTRKRATMVRGGWDAISRNDERMIEYVRDHPRNPRRYRQWW